MTRLALPLLANVMGGDHGTHATRTPAHPTDRFERSTPQDPAQALRTMARQTPAAPRVAGDRNSEVARIASSWDRQTFKAGMTRRCADFVSTVLTAAGAQVKPSQLASELAFQGQRVNEADLKAGDAVFFRNTYQRGRYTHVGIYLGDGKFEHRPTADQPVKVDSLDNPYWSAHFNGGRRY